MKTLDDVFRLLDRERRRYALYYLQEAGGPVPVEELVAVIAEWESDASADADEYDEFDVALTLEH